MKVYIAGPMTGYPDFNYPAFAKIAHEWREAGYTVVNPAKHFDGDQTLPYETYMRKAISSLLNVDAIAMMEGWRNSKGAKMELLLAQKMGHYVFNAHTRVLFNAPKLIVDIDTQFYPMQIVCNTGSIPCFNQ